MNWDSCQLLLCQTECSASDLQPVFPAGSLLGVRMEGCLEHGNVITKASQGSQNQGSQSLWCLEGFLMFITLAALALLVNGPPRTVQVALGHASCCLWACGLLSSLPCQHIPCTDSSYFTEASWRLNLYKGLPPICSDSKQRVPQELLLQHQA